MLFVVALSHTIPSTTHLLQIFHVCFTTRSVFFLRVPQVEYLTIIVCGYNEG